MKTCPYCAEEIQTAAIVCKHCGRDLNPRRRRRGLVGVGLLLAIVCAFGAFYLWATSAYSVDLTTAQNIVMRLESDGVLTNRRCRPNRAAVRVAWWAGLPNERTRRNLLLNLSRVCIGEGAPPDMELLDAQTGQAFVMFDGSKIVR